MIVVMNIKPRWIDCVTMAIAAVLVTGIAPISGEPAGADQAVRAVLDRQVIDWNKGDLDGFLSGYWKSPKVVFQSGGQRFDGWEAMRDRYRSRYQGTGRAMGRLSFSRLEIEDLGPEAALARGRWQLVMPDGTKPAGLFTLIFRKLPEGWKIVHDHTSTDETVQTGGFGGAGRMIAAKTRPPSSHPPSSSIAAPRV
jgi:beta-aspartyl-peptidase (threonine type)